MNTVHFENFWVKMYKNVHFPVSYVCDLYIKYVDHVHEIIITTLLHSKLMIHILNIQTL